MGICAHTAKQHQSRTSDSPWLITPRHNMIQRRPCRNLRLVMPQEITEDPPSGHRHPGATKKTGEALKLGARAKSSAAKPVTIAAATAAPAAPAATAPITAAKPTIAAVPGGRAGLRPCRHMPPMAGRFGRSKAAIFGAGMGWGWFDDECARLPYSDRLRLLNSACG